MYTHSGMTQRKHGTSHNESSQDWDLPNPDPLYTSASAQGSHDALIHTAGKSARDESGSIGPTDQPPYAYRPDGRF